jgi:DNA-binding response OmpR family regulator
MNILIIEDELNSAEMLGMLLGLQGHAVSIALTGQVGLDLAASTHPDLAIVDLLLPDMEGLAVIAALHRGTVPCTCIALTNIDDPAMRSAAEAAGVEHYLLKSADISKLLAVIDALSV